MKDSKKNLVWINLIKGICILFVFFNHSEFYADVSSGWFGGIYGPFFVNLFLIISGYLLFKKYLHSANSAQFNGGGYLRNIIFRIIIPSTIFATLIFFPKQLIRSENINIYEFLYDTIGGGAMWFTSALAVSQILIGILLVARCHRTITYIIYGILLTVVANYLTESGCDINYYYFRSGMIATLFLAIGGLYFRYESKITDILQNRKFAIINILFFVLYCFLTINTDWVKSSVNSGSVNFLGVLSATYISINIIWLVKKMPDIPLLSYIGKNSILFYFFSGAIPNVIAIIASRFLGLTGANSLFATFVLSIIIAYIVVYIIVSYFPWLVDIRKLKSDRIQLE